MVQFLGSLLMVRAAGQSRLFFLYILKSQTDFFRNCRMRDKEKLGKIAFSHYYDSTLFLTKRERLHHEID